MRAPHDKYKTETYRSQLVLAHMERLVFLSERRLDLDVVLGPGTLPRCCLLGPEPRPRKLAPRVQIRKVSKGLCSERCKARNKVAQFARPVVGAEIVQHTDE